MVRGPLHGLEDKVRGILVLTSCTWPILFVLVLFLWIFRGVGWLTGSVRDPLGIQTLISNPDAKFDWVPCLKVLELKGLHSLLSDCGFEGHICTLRQVYDLGPRSSELAPWLCPCFLTYSMACGVSSLAQQWSLVVVRTHTYLNSQKYSIVDPAVWRWLNGRVEFVAMT